MSDQTTPETTPETTARTFYRSDYRRAASLIQSFRHVKGDPYTSKGPQAEALADQLASVMADVFMTDLPGSGNFDYEKFLAGTQLPPAPEYVPVTDPYNAEAQAAAELAEYGETS